jgi:hypothetical protein
LIDGAVGGRAINNEHLVNRLREGAVHSFLSS